MFEYIQKFGGVVISNQVLYSRFSEGPFKGKYNGERKYQVDFTNSSRSMGTYHWLDGSRVRISIEGMKKPVGDVIKTQGHAQEEQLQGTVKKQVAKGPT